MRAANASQKSMHFSSKVFPELKFCNYLTGNKKAAIIFASLRGDEADYFEAVIAKDELPKLVVLFEKVFGPAALPSQNKLSPEIEKIIEDCGGIMSGQSLYLSQESGVVFAMLWPWSDGKNTTVKIGKK